MISPCFAWSFRKKQDIKPKEKMVETRQEWELEAQSIPLNLRELKEFEPNKTDKKTFYPEPHYTFEKYNYPAGSREDNIEVIKKKLDLIPNLIADSKVNYVAYTRHYFLSEYNQLSSAFFVEKLDTTKTKAKRILNYIHNQQKRTPILEVGNNEIYPNLFKGLFLVDWSKDSKKILIKEKVGSLNNGIYKTYLYVHFLNDKDSYTLKLDNFDEAIRKYFLDWQNIQLQKYRYDIHPLGFSSQNDNLIISYCFAYNVNGEKVFLGIWGYDIEKNQTILISKTMQQLDISSNGIFLKQVIY